MSIDPAEKATRTGVAEDLVAVSGRLLAGVATGLWRLRERTHTSEAGLEQPNRSGRTALRHLQATWDALLELGVEVQDPTGSRFDSGLTLTSLAFHPVPGLETETVIETVRPTVYFGRTIIQVGEVIVGVPERSEPWGAEPVDPPANVDADLLGPVEGLAERAAGERTGEGAATP